MKVYKAIANITSAMAKSGISKDNKNQQQGYKFRGIDDVYNALAPKLAEHGLCIIPRVVDRSVTERETRNGGVLFYTTLTVEFDFVSAEDGSTHTARMVGEAMDSADKSSNKAMSAAYKYACLQTFCIPTEGDNDADATTHEVTSVATKKPDTVSGASAQAPYKPQADKRHPQEISAEIITKLNAIRSRTQLDGYYKGTIKPFLDTYKEFTDLITPVLQSVGSKFPKEKEHEAV